MFKQFHAFSQFETPNLRGMEFFKIGFIGGNEKNCFQNVRMDSFSEEVNTLWLRLDVDFIKLQLLNMTTINPLYEMQHCAETG